MTTAATSRIPGWRQSRRAIAPAAFVTAVAATGLMCAAGSPAASPVPDSPGTDDAGNMLLIHRSLRVEPVQVTELAERVLLYMDADGGWQRVDPADVIALIDEDARRTRRATGLAVLTDGQQIPGSVSPGGQEGSVVLGWRHTDLGTLNLPLELLSVVLIGRDAEIPPVGQSDVLLLSNGDVHSGFLLELGDPIVIEMTGADGDVSELRIPLDRVSAMRIVNPDTQSTRTRVWLTDGTVTDVHSISVQQEDGYAHMHTPWHRTDSQRDEMIVRMEEIAAILLNPGHMTPLASLRPTRVEGPPTRYVIPPPRVIEDDAPLGLAPIEYRGPLTAYYALPENAIRFAAHAVLPESARTWGDLELIIRVDGVAVFHQTLNAETPEIPIAFDVDGSELTIELLEGVNGPIQDQMVLKRAMIGLGE